MEYFEEFGEWWLPGSSDDPIPGTLEYDPSEGAQLTLTGAFPEEERDGPQHVPARTWGFDRIYGDIGQGRKVTLRKTINTSVNESYGDVRVTEEQYGAETVFIGQHLQENHEFEQLSLTIPGLEQWINMPTIHRITDPKKLEELAPDEDVLSGFLTTSSKTVSTSIEGWTIILESANFTKDQVYSAEFESKGLIRVVNEGSAEFSDLVDIGDKVLNYVSIGVGRGIYPEEMKVAEPEGGTRRIEVYPKSPNSNSQLPPSKAEYQFRPDGDEIGSRLENWWRLREEAEIFSQHYQELLFNSDLPHAHSFLSAVIALEAYFQYLHPDISLIDEDEYDSLVDEMISTVPENSAIRPRIEGLLTSIGNKPSLRRQLEMIVNRYGDTISQCIDVDSTIKDARDMRHDIAHGLNDVDLEELIQLNQRLDLILNAIVLSEIGVNTEEILDRFEFQYPFVDLD